MTTVQDVFLKFYNAYKEKYTPNAQQAKAAKDIMECRTSAMGGHAHECPECKHTVVQYNSCRNRHCPLCQGVTKAVWIDKRRSDVLDAPYFHAVFTMPPQLHSLIYQNQEILYGLMYKAVSETLMELSQDKKYLGAQIGFFSILHTWGQDLHYHPHLHTVILAGGLTKSNQWRKTSNEFFIPIRVLSKKFRGKYLYYLKKYYLEGKLEFYSDAEKYRKLENFNELLCQCYNQNWYTYTQRTFSGPLAVIQYLGRYTHRIAIANSRIISMNKHSVTITVKDYKDDNKMKMLTMDGVEFIRRFLMHILPKGFVKIRYNGILANRNKKTKLELCRQLTMSTTYSPRFEGLSILEILCVLTNKDVTLCPACGKGKMQAVRAFPKGGSP